MVVAGIASINFSSQGNSLLQLRSTPEMRGRVMSLWSVAFLGSTTLGGPAVGWFGEVAGPRWGLALGGAAALAAAAVGALLHCGEFSRPRTTAPRKATRRFDVDARAPAPHTTKSGGG